MTNSDPIRISDDQHNNAPAVPQGWKLVPIEPTPAMRLAGRKAPDAMEEIWAAMLAATPAPAPAINYHPGTWYEVKSREELEAFFLSRLPAIRDAAHEHGYAIGLHGSLRRDMDLIAVPWRDGASDKDKLAHAIAMAAVGMTRNGGYEWETKPAGRVATSLPCCWTPWHGEAGSGHIDLSVMTPAPAQGEPFGYFRAEPFGWTDCSEDAEGAIALYEHPAKPAQEVGLTDAGIAALWRYFADSNQVIRIEQDRFANLVRTIEKLIPATRISDRQFDLICQAIDKADTVTMDGDYMLDSDDCIRVIRVMQVLFDIAALRAKGAV